MRFQSYFNTAVQLVTAYKGNIPLAHYLRNYFAQHKKHGSRDRKQIAHLCYCYYRLGKALQQLSAEERIRAALFVCNASIADWAIIFEAHWLANHNTALPERIAFLTTLYGFNTPQIFPWQTSLSEGMPWQVFAQSHLVQPSLFLRIRPGKKNMVVEKLLASNIAYRELEDDCLVLANTSQVDKILVLDKEAVVQDYSSQQIASFLRLIKPTTAGAKQVTIWDCCAASGGKSILAADTLGNVQLTVSDIRASIISNLEKRFSAAGITNYSSLVADISLAPKTLHPKPFNLVICDAPCSGSGTWGRTPEQLYFFTEDKIAAFARLQQKIITNALPYVKEGGWFLYITCSVFAQENEAAVSYILQQGYALVKKEILAGYGQQADTMFAALLQKKLG